MRVYLLVLVLFAAVWLPLGVGAQEPLPTFHGVLKSMNNKTIVIVVEGKRPLELRRSGKTKFYRDSKRIKASELNPGDPVAVEARENALNASLEAVNVYLQSGKKSGGSMSRH